MIAVYYLVNETLHKGGIDELSTAALWIDLLEPTPDEEAAVEAVLGIGVPTREEMQEIEASSRLYREGEAIYMTAPVLTNSDSFHPQNTAVTFILARTCAITVRYGTPLPFTTFAVRATRQRGLALTADAVLAGLLETIVDRLADVLERIGGELDLLSREIFAPPNPALSAKARRRAVDYHATLRGVGRHGDLTGKARDSILGLGRVLSYLSQVEETLPGKETRQRVRTMTRDLRSLSEHAAFLSGKINFLLDATLGMINIEQNNIIKLFSVVAVIFLPPTLIASMYGMNFQFMPELAWPLGYPMALVLMLLSAILPYVFFKHRGWF